MNIIEAIGLGVIHTFWQTAIIYVFLLVLYNKIFKKHAARYALALLAQLCTLVAFFVTIIYYINNPAPYLPAITTVPLKLLLPYLSWFYFTFLSLSIFRTAVDYFKLNRIISTKSAAIDGKIVSFVDVIKKALSISQIRIFYVNYDGSAFVNGFLKPAIYLPVSLCTHLTAAQVEAVILHELMHIKRWDYQINIGQIIIEKLLYFNPLVKALGAVARKEREILCDHEVKKLYDPVIYSEALLKIAKVTFSHPAKVKATGNSNAELLYRIKLLFGFHTEKLKLKYAHILLSTLVTLCLLVPLGHQHQANKAIDKKVTFNTLPSELNIKTIAQRESAAEELEKWSASPVNSVLREELPIHSSSILSSSSNEVKQSVDIKSLIPPIPIIQQNKPAIYKLVAQNNDEELLATLKEIDALLLNISPDLQPYHSDYHVYQAAYVDADESGTTIYQTESHYQNTELSVHIVEYGYESYLTFSVN